MNTDTRRYVTQLPAGMRYLAWSPQWRPATAEGEPNEGDTWGLAGINEAAHPF